MNQDRSATETTCPPRPDDAAFSDAPHTVSALFTDLYELTMLQAYFAEGMEENAVFSLFVRRLPETRNYLLACGLDTVLTHLENLRFTADDIAYLASLNQFSRPFLDRLAGFRFTGDVYAVPEGTPLFANEPILEIVAPVAEAQVIETLVMNQINVETLLASKAARVVHAARGRPVIDFGARRMHGLDAALKAARAFHIAGVSATSNMLAGRVYGLPVSGTMAHSYIQTHASEMEAFRAFAREFPDTVLLVDTYDTLGGVDKVIALAGELGDDFRVHGIRLDSGDLGALARAARGRLDAAGLRDVEIVASGGLDEYGIDDLLGSGAPIDGFGVGTAMGVSSDAPTLDLAYKLTAYAGEGRLKLSKNKPILPGRKQVFRTFADHRYTHDVIGGAEEIRDGRPLMRQAMREGKRLDGACVGIDEARAHADREVGRLPGHVRALQPAEPAYPVDVSEQLKAYHDRVVRRISE